MLSADIPHLLEVLLTAMACGALIGAEREWTRHDAGLRTNTLVSLGAAVYGFLSMHAFGGSTTDPSRIAAQVVTGIGFIGAGVILQRRRRVMGLTTAATLWVAAGVGLAAGGGQFTLAWTSAIFVLLVQVVLRALESAFNAYRRRIRDLQLRYLLIVKTPDKVDRNLERIVLDAISRGDVRLVRAVAA
ncbi:MAG TPA: MgtC/SapB family protein, partial [bacterium]|nr:MgtC/SapB family protein [bacterium]